MNRRDFLKDLGLILGGIPFIPSPITHPHWDYPHPILDDGFQPDITLPVNSYCGSFTSFDESGFTIDWSTSVEFDPNDNFILFDEPDYEYNYIFVWVDKDGNYQYQKGYDESFPTGIVNIADGSYDEDYPDKLELQ